MAHPTPLDHHAMYRTHYLEQAPAGWGNRLRRSKALLPTLAVLLVTVGALAATLVVRESGAMQDTRPALATGAPVDGAPAAQRAQALVADAPRGAGLPAAQRAPRPVAAPAERTVAAAPVCSNCGTVESVQAVQRAGAASGVGAVAGGVVGGLLGNQVGGGSGRTAATVLGVAGGGYAGHQIEKNMKKTTSYRVRVRMQDGSLRTLEQSSAPAAGTPVVVDGGVARVAQSAAAAASAYRAG